MKVRSIATVGLARSAVSPLLARASGWPVTHCRTGKELYQSVARGGVSLVACGPSDIDGQCSARFVELIAHDFQTVPIIGVVSCAQSDGSRIASWARSGIHALLIADDRLTVLDARAALTEAIVRAAASSGRADVLGAAPRHVQPLLEYGLRSAHEAPTVSGAARALSVTRKTLSMWCKRAGTQNPQVLMGWCRLVAAAALLEDERRRVEHTALDIALPSGNALRNLVRRNLSLSVAELRELGPQRTVLRRFQEALRGAAGPLLADRRSNS